MNLPSLVAHRAARRAILAFVGAVAAAVFAVLWTFGLFSPNARLGAALGAGAVFLCAGGVVLLSALDRLLEWERRLADLGEGPIDPFALSTASGVAPADHCWNSLVEQWRGTRALAELERAVAAKLDAGGGAADQLLDSICDGVAAVDAAGKIVYANSVMAGICGVESAHELRGRDLPTALRVDEASAARLGGAPSAAQFAAELATDGDPAKSRTLRGVRRAAAGPTEDGVAHVWTIRDVTQQRLAESMREKFLSAATHEFRTPLANIRAYAESLDMGHDIDAEARKRFYNVIQSESIRLSQLVDDLLDISRMQAGALALENRETDLTRLVEEAAAMVQGQMKDKQIQFRCELPPKLPKIVADKGKLTAAIVNLLGNAAKYTPNGGKVTFRVDLAGGGVQFFVADTGIGIAPEELPNIFDRFFRSTDSRVREINGSGLGLALSLEIARLHGGDIVVESALNRGTTFRMTIPLATAV